MGCQPQNRGTQIWMVKIMENPIKMDDLGVPLFLETLIYRQWVYLQQHWKVKVLRRIPQKCDVIVVVTGILGGGTHLRYVQ